MTNSLKLEFRNPFSCESSIKFEENNYKLWSSVFMMSVTGRKTKFLLEEDEPVEMVGKNVS